MGVASHSHPTESGSDGQGTEAAETPNDDRAEKDFLRGVPMASEVISTLRQVIDALNIN